MFVIFCQVGNIFKISGYRQSVSVRFVLRHRVSVKLVMNQAKCAAIFTRYSTLTEKCLLILFEIKSGLYFSAKSAIFRQIAAIFVVPINLRDKFRFDVFDRVSFISARRCHNTIPAKYLQGSKYFARLVISD